MRRDKKGQVWYTDFVVAVMIFVISLIIYYEYITNISAREEVIINELVADAKSISNALVSDGNPVDWNSSNVIRIGLTDGNTRLNQTKLINFYDLNYNLTHKIFNTRHEVYVFLVNKTGGKINISGMEATGKEPDKPKDIVQMSRVLIYQSEIVKLQVQLWR